MEKVKQKEESCYSVNKEEKNHEIIDGKSLQNKSRSIYKRLRRENIYEEQIKRSEADDKRWKKWLRGINEDQKFKRKERMK